MAADHANLVQDIEQIISGMGLSLVSLHQQVVSGRLQASVVVHRPDGVSLEDCTRVHRTVQPRIALLTGRRDINLEVSSPGIGRKLRNPEEYKPFVGSMIQVLPRDGDWFPARLVSCDETGLELEQDGSNTRMSFDDITVSRLDDTV